MTSTALFEVLPRMGEDWARFEYHEYMRKCVKTGVQAKSFLDFIRFMLFEMEPPEPK